MAVPVQAHGALGLYSAVGDAFAGRRLGFGRRRAAVAARFARYRGAGDDAVAANWIAGALAEIGLCAVILRGDAPPHERILAVADAPFHGAHIVAGLPGVPAHAADTVRWHREHDDGTGVPDALRWDGVPADAAALGIVHGFLEVLEDPSEEHEAIEALFAVGNESGRKFGIERLRVFREFVMHAPDWDEPVSIALPALDEEAAIRSLAGRLDARDSETEGRSERLAALAGPLATELGLDAVRAQRLARLLALGRAAEDVPRDAFDPLSRFARDYRTATAARAADIAGSVERYGDDAPILAASADWYEDGPLEPYAAVLSVSLAVAAMPPREVARRLAAAAGTQLDPATTHAYLVSRGAET